MESLHWDVLAAKDDADEWAFAARDASRRAEEAQRRAHAQRQGTRVVSVAQDSTYEGEWTNAGANGYGVLVGPRVVSAMSSGSIFGERNLYRGEWVSGAIEGAGVYDRPSAGGGGGLRYIGRFRAGRYHGAGVLMWGNTQMYCGEFVNGQRHGIGMMMYADRRLYSGHWERDRYNGEGISFNGLGYIDGYGIWTDGRLTRRLQSR